MYSRAFFAGAALWLVGTIVFRLGPAAMIKPPAFRETVLSYVINAAMALVVSRLLMRLVGVTADARPAAITLFILPTLLLDPFATAFFPVFFPNLPKAAAPTFGGLMLISAAGAVIGAWLP